MATTPDAKRQIPGIILVLLMLLLIELIVVILLQFGLWQVLLQLFVKEGHLPATTEVSKETVSNYLHDEEAVILDDHETILPVEDVLFEYVRVKDSCGPFFDGVCVRVRSGPGTEFPVVHQVRNDVVLKVGGKVEHDDRTWYKVVFDEWLRYPERLGGEWYIAAEYVEVLKDAGDKSVSEPALATTSKRIIVDRSEQTLYAYDGDALFLETKISTGLELTPTPRGTFIVFRKTPSRYMQGPLPYLVSQDYYDLPGVPWNLYFTEQGAVIHGAYWHNSFGTPYSHGCVNLEPTEARRLYEWAVLGTTVVVRD